MSRPFPAKSFFILPSLVLLAANSQARLIITEVAPGVASTATKGDLVELYNAGNQPIDLTGYILTDLDGLTNNSLLSQGTFAPASANLPPLLPGQFAVVEFVYSTSDYFASSVPYGLYLRANLYPPFTGQGFLNHDWEELVLADSEGRVLDCLAWFSSTLTPASSADTIADFNAITIPSAYGYTLIPDNAWAGPASISTLAEYQQNAINFTAFTGSTTWGNGAISRRFQGGAFMTGAPDGLAQWETVPMHRASFGSFPSPTLTSNGLRVRQEAGDLIDRLVNLNVADYPAFRVDPSSNTDRFQRITGANASVFRQVATHMLAGEWERANLLADQLGMRVVEFHDISGGFSVYILEETAIPGEPAYRGRGVFVFDPNREARRPFVLQMPHPIFDRLTLEQGGLAIPQVRPRVAMFAGTHRNNSTELTPCSGTMGDGSPYRVSDVAHHFDNFFHVLHEVLATALPDGVFLQLHGFANDVPDPNVIISNGFGAPAPDEFSKLLQLRIDAQNHIVDDGTPGGNRTTAAVFGESTTRFAARTNLQARLLNCVSAANVCLTNPTCRSGRFVHVEQDFGVRSDPQHIITSIIETIDIYFGAIPEPAPDAFLMF